MRIYQILIILFSLFLIGCNPSYTGDVVIDEVFQYQDTINSITHTMLRSLNEDNYQRFITSFSDDMKQVSTIHKYADLKKLVREHVGYYAYCDEPILLPFENLTAHVYNCVFEKENVTATFFFDSGGIEIEGFFISSETIDNVSIE